MTGKPGLLQSMGLQKVRHNLMTEQQEEHILISMSHFISFHRQNLMPCSKTTQAHYFSSLKI